jgi:hypothetical protein
MYDTVAKILYSGDLVQAPSEGATGQPGVPMNQIARATPAMPPTM